MKYFLALEEFANSFRFYYIVCCIGFNVKDQILVLV